MCIGQSESDPLLVFSGVPQGSVIGPLLFLIIIDGIASALNLDTDVNISMFADDTKVFGTCSAQMQQSINDIAAWIRNHNLKLATHKCCILNIKKPHITQNTPYYINNTVLKSVPDVKDLGIYITSNLKWSKHISHICHQANLVSYRILKSFRTKNIWTFKKLFTTYIRPKLEFNTPVWSPFLLKDITHIEQVQRHYTKVAFSRCGIPFVSYADRLDKINLSSLENRRKYFDMVLLFKMIHGLSDLDFHDYFQFHDTPYLLRSHSFQIKSKKRFMSSQWLNSFFTRAPKYWNLLPCDIVSTNSLSIFKSRMKSYKFHS